MKNNDSNDPLPEDENLGSAGSPHSTGRTLHQRSADFERAEQEGSPAHCEVCGASIPPTNNRCSDHQQSSKHETTASGDSWSISNVGVVIVAASSKFHALANASVALRRRDGSHGSDDSFDLIYDFGEPSTTLTSNWGGELPDAAKLSTPVGEDLLERAFSKIDSNDSERDGEIAGIDVNLSVLGQPSNSGTYLFNERGEAITDEQQINALSDGPENGDHNYWAIPAVLYSSSQESSPEPQRSLDCVNCGVSQHTFDRAIENPGVDGQERIGVWVCLECNSRKAGAPPTKPGDESISKETVPTTSDEKPINKAEENQFETMMERLESEGRLGNASESR
jgi:hypothetical protein